MLDLLRYNASTCDMCLHFFMCNIFVLLIIPKTGSCRRSSRVTPAKGRSRSPRDTSVIVRRSGGPSATGVLRSRRHVHGRGGPGVQRGGRSRQQPDGQPGGRCCCYVHDFAGWVRAINKTIPDERYRSSCKLYLFPWLYDVNNTDLFNINPGVFWRNILLYRFTSFYWKYPLQINTIILYQTKLYINKHFTIMLLL